jgi:hypothetical protein
MLNFFLFVFVFAFVPEFEAGFVIVALSSDEFERNGTISEAGRGFHKSFLAFSHFPMCLALDRLSLKRLLQNSHSNSDAFDPVSDDCE